MVLIHRSTSVLVSFHSILKCSLMGIVGGMQLADDGCKGDRGVVKGFFDVLFHSVYYSNKATQMQMQSRITTPNCSGEKSGPCGVEDR